MKKLLLIILSLFICSSVFAASITYPTKSTGDQYTAAEANEVKAVVNGKTDVIHLFDTDATVSSNLAIDLSTDEREQKLTFTGNSAVTVTNWTSGGRETVIIYATNAGNYTTTFAGVSAATLELTTDGKDVIFITTLDGGSNYYVEADNDVNF